MDYEISFRRSTLFMVKEKYPDLDFSNISFSDMRGLEEEGRNVQVATTEGARESVQGDEVQVQTVETITIDPPTPGVESIVNDVNESSPVNAHSD